MDKPMAQSTFLFSFSFIKNTNAEPNVVPKNGINNRKVVPDSLTSNSFFVFKNTPLESISNVELSIFLNFIPKFFNTLIVAKTSLLNVTLYIFECNAEKLKIIKA